MIFQIILVALATLAIYYYLFKKKKLKLPPGPTGLPLIGNVLAVSGKPYQVYTKWQKEFGDIFSCRFGRIKVIVIGNIKLIRECFNEPVFSGRSGDIMICFLSKGKHGVLASEGAEWVDQRRFTLRHLRNFGFGKNYMETLIMEEVNEFTDWLKREEGNSLDMNEKFELAVLNSLWMIITGKKFRQDDAHHLEIMRIINETFTKPSVTGILNLLAPSLLKLAPELLGVNKFNKIVNDFHHMLLEIIQEHEETLPENALDSRDFIDAYLHEIKKTNEESSSFYKETGLNSLMAVVGDMFFAGSETTSSTMSWTILYLALNPDIQKTLQDEIDRVVGKSRTVSLADRPKLLYADATVLEIFRKSSIVVTGVMHTALEDTTFHGYDIPKNSWIMPNIYAIHHDPRIWGDPENFRPDRFLSVDGKTVEKNENLVQFSLGKRACIGEHLARDTIFLFMTNIFQRFTIKLDPSKPTPTYDAKEGFILKPDDYLVIMTERHA